MSTVTDDTAADVIASIDHFLRVVAAVRQTKPRDPLRAVEDALLDLRRGVEVGAR